MVVHGMSPDQVARLARKAWIALVLAPVGFLVAIAVGEGIYGLLGYEAADAAPLSARLTAALPALALQAAPAFFAARWGHRAFSDPAVTIGGGLTVRLTDHWSLRPQGRALIVFRHNDSHTLGVYDVSLGYRF